MFFLIHWKVVKKNNFMPQLDDLNMLDIITGTFLNLFSILIINYFDGADLVDDADEVNLSLINII